MADPLAQVAEVLEKHRIHHTNAVCLGCEWDALTAADPSFLRHQADMLAAAGLVASEVEGAIFYDFDPEHPNFRDPYADHTPRWWALQAENPHASVKVRGVTPWRAAEAGDG